MAAESGRQPAAVKFPMLAYPTLTLMLAPLAATSISLLLAVAALPSEPVRAFLDNQRHITERFNVVDHSRFAK